jgi:hypothetical protein
MPETKVHNKAEGLRSGGNRTAQGYFRRRFSLKAAPRFELRNNGFAIRGLNHLAMPPINPVQCLQD